MYESFAPAHFWSAGWELRTKEVAGMRKRSYPSALSESVLELLGSRETLSFRSVRRQYLPYFFAFPLAMIFINVENFFLVPYPGTAGLSVTTYAFFAFTAGAITFFVCCRDDNTARISKYAAILAAAGLVPWLVMPAGLPSFLCLLILMAGIGGCVSCSSFPFVFVLNNAERFYGSVLMLLSIRLVKLFALLPAIPPLLRKTAALLLAVPLVFSMLLSRQEDFTGKGAREAAQFDRGVWLSVFILIAYFAVRITGFYAPAFSHLPASFLWGALELLPLLLCIAVQVIFRRSVWTLCNIFFLSALLSYWMWYAGLPEMAHMFAELKELGFLAAFYLVGCVTNRFCDFRMHKRLVLLCISLVGALFLAVELLQLRLPGTPAAVVTAAGFFAAFLLLSPAFSQYLFLSDWSGELSAVYMCTPPAAHSDTGGLVRQVSRLDGTNLSPREKQVALLLLQGMTLRQIAPELKLTPATVATYSKSIYKKLGINSRAELFIRFGAEHGSGDEK